MERKRAFQMKQRFERCKTPSGSVPISVIMGFDYPLGGVSNTFLKVDLESLELFKNIWVWNVVVSLLSVRQRGEWAGGGKVVVLLLCEKSRGPGGLQEQYDWDQQLQHSQHGLYEQTHAGQAGQASHHVLLALVSLPVQNIHSEDLPDQSSHGGESTGTLQWQIQMLRSASRTASLSKCV